MHCSCNKFEKMVGHVVGLRLMKVAVIVTITVPFLAACAVFLRAIAVESPANSHAGKCYRHRDLPISEEALHRFSRVLQIPTVSYDPGESKSAIRVEPKTTESNLLALISLIETSFPVIHNSSLVTFEVINKFSLLYTIKGSNEKLKPYMLAAHLDVVPANAEKWDHPPFGGVIDKGFIHGRGTMDDKQNVMGILEALENLLKTGFQPSRTIYLAFGHDEEIMGFNGAQEIARTLISRNVQLQFILDEGYFVANYSMKFMKSLLAMIGVSEKGLMTLKLSVKSNPGHSSAPPTNTVIGVLAKAVSRLEENPHRNMFGKGVEISMLEQMSSYAPFIVKLVLANLWLFSSIVSRMMAMDRHQNAFIRTTTAVTMFNSGVKSNVLPDEAVAFVNHRIHQSQTADEVLRRDIAIIDDDRVNVEVVTMLEPSPVSPFAQDTFGYQVIKETVQQVHCNVAVVPAPLMASTDWEKSASELLSRFSARYSSVVIRTKLSWTEFNHYEFFRIVSKDHVKAEIFIQGNQRMIHSLLSLILDLKWLCKHSLLVLLCDDCQNAIEVFRYSQDIVGDVIVCTNKKINNSTFELTLKGVTYDYTKQKMYSIYLGRWTAKTGLEMTDQMPNSFKNFRFHGALLNILTNRMTPYVDNYADPTGTSLPTGAVGEILGIIQQQLGFKLNITESNHDTYGEITDNGSFTMMLGQFQKDKYDLGIGILSTTPTRMIGFDFTSHFMEGNVVFIMYNSAKGKSLEALTFYLKPFNISLWLTLQVLLFVATLALYITVRWSRFCTNAETKPGHYEKAPSTKVVLTTSYILYFILASIYTGLLMSSLTVDKTMMPRTIKELANFDYTIGMTRGNSITELVQMSMNPDLMKITKQSTTVEAFKGTKDACLLYNHAYLTSVAMFKYRQRMIPKCKAMMLPEVVFYDNYHFITQKNDVLSRRLSYVITRMVETGIQKRVGLHYNLENNRDILDKKGNNQFMAITVKHFTVPIGILTSGIGMAFILLAIEIIYRTKTRPKRK